MTRVRFQPSSHSSPLLLSFMVTSSESFDTKSEGGKWSSNFREGQGNPGMNVLVNPRSRMKDPSHATRPNASSSRSKSKGFQSKSSQGNANSRVVAAAARPQTAVETDCCGNGAERTQKALAANDRSNKPPAKKLQSNAPERKLKLQSKAPERKLKRQSKAQERKLKRLRRWYPSKEQLLLQRRRRVERAIRRMRYRRQYYSSPQVYSNEAVSDVLCIRPFEVQGLRAADHLGAERQRDSPTDWGQHDLDSVDTVHRLDGSLTPLSVGSYSPGGRHSVGSLTTASPPASPTDDVAVTLTQRLLPALVSPDCGPLPQTTIADSIIISVSPATPSEAEISGQQRRSGASVLGAQTLNAVPSSDLQTSPLSKRLEELESARSEELESTRSEELESPRHEELESTRSASVGPFTSAVNFASSGAPSGSGSTSASLAASGCTSPSDSSVSGYSSASNFSSASDRPLKTRFQCYWDSFPQSPPTTSKSTLAGSTEASESTKPAPVPPTATPSTEASEAPKPVPVPPAATPQRRTQRCRALLPPLPLQNVCRPNLPPIPPRDVRPSHPLSVTCNMVTSL